jgi:transposase-like protein
LEELKKCISEFGYVKTGKKYGVSDNCIRKWLKKYMEE